MFTFISWIKKGIYPIFGVSSSDLELDISKKLYFFTAIALSTIFTVFTIHQLIQGAYLFALLQFCIVACTFISWLLFRKTGSTNLAGSFLLCFAVIVSFLNTFWMGGLHAPSLHLWPLVPLFTTVTMTFSYACFWTAIYVMMSLFFYFAAQMGMNFTPRVTPDAIESIRIVAIVTAHILILTVINYVRRINRNYRFVIAKQKDEKTNLVRVLTHDVATPMTILKTSIRRLEKQMTGPSVDLQRMSHSIQVISSIFEHVRELEAISSGKKEMVLQKVNLVDIFDELKELHINALESKQINFSIEYKNLGGTFQVMADRKSLCYQVLNNLISNSIKFTDPGGSIKVLVESNFGVTKCSIMDTGIGIPQEIILNLFNTSVKTTRTGTSGETGTGFGMPIVKNYIEKFNGKIEVHSALKSENATNHGTTITITLPNVAA